MSEVEKARNDVYSAFLYGDETRSKFASYEKAVRAEAIAETEAKFRELAEKWRQESVAYSCLMIPFTLGFITDSESLLTTCPQSRHDAGEKSKP